jgi:molybdopterin synthase sulfur carrier subunit
MKVLVKFFASYRETAGAAEEVIEAPEGSTVGDIVETVASKHPSLGPMKDAIRALNQNIVEADVKVKDGDTLAVFPLVGGG